VWGALTLQTARTDDPLASVKAPQASQKAPPADQPDHLQAALAEMSATLPGSDDRGHTPAPRNFATGKDAIAYARRRFADYARVRQHRDSGK